MGGFIALGAVINSLSPQLGAGKSGRAADALDDVASGPPPTPPSPPSPSTGGSKPGLVRVDKPRPGSGRGASHYEVLGVEPDATPDQIKRAYRKRARETHPDINHGADRGVFQRVQEAFAVLSDEAQRAAYDAVLGAGEGAPLFELLDQGRFDAAIALINELDVGAAALFAVAEACFQTGRDQLGFDFLYAAHAAAPDDAPSAAVLATHYLMIGYWERARELAKVFEDSWSSHLILAEVAGQAAFFLELYSESVGALTLAAEHQQGRVDLYTDLVVAAVQAKDVEAAKKSLNALDPYLEAGDPEFRRFVGRLHLELLEFPLRVRDFDQARELVSRAAQLGVPSAEIKPISQGLGELETAHRKGELPSSWEPGPTLMAKFKLSLQRSGIGSAAQDEAKALEELRSETLRKVGKSAAGMVHNGEWDDGDSKQTLEAVTKLLHEIKDLDQQIVGLQNRPKPQGLLQMAFDAGGAALNKMGLESDKKQRREKIERTYQSLGEKILKREPVPQKWRYHQARVQRLGAEEKALKAQGRRFA